MFCSFIKSCEVLQAKATMVNLLNFFLKIVFNFTYIPLIFFSNGRNMSGGRFYPMGVFTPVFFCTL